MNCPEEEKRIIQLAQKGVFAEFNQFLVRKGPTLLSIAGNILKNSAEAEDAVQESLLAAFRNIGKFRFDSRFDTWLYRITVNKCLTHRKTKRFQSESVPLDETIFSGEAHDPEHQMAQSDSRSQIRKALAQLQRPMRTAVVLFHLHELKYVEIAETMEMPLNTVKTLIRRGRERLASILKKHGEDGK